MEKHLTAPSINEDLSFLGELANSEIGFLKSIGYLNPNTLLKYNIETLNRCNLSTDQKH